MTSLPTTLPASALKSMMEQMHPSYCGPSALEHLPASVEDIAASTVDLVEAQRVIDPHLNPYAIKFGALEAAYLHLREKAQTQAVIVEKLMNAVSTPEGRAELMAALTEMSQHDAPTQTEAVQPVATASHKPVAGTISTRVSVPVDLHVTLSPADWQHDYDRQRSALSASQY